MEGLMNHAALLPILASIFLTCKEPASLSSNYHAQCSQRGKGQTEPASYEVMRDREEIDASNYG